MKKLITIVAAILALAMVACSQKKPETVLQVTDLPEEFNGQYAYRYDIEQLAAGEEVRLDSVLITDGAFKMVLPADESQRAFVKFAEEQIGFALEEGQLVFKSSVDENQMLEFELTTAPEGGLNAKVEQMQQEIQEMVEPLYTQLKEARDKYQAATTDEERTVASDEFEQARQQIMAKSNEVAQNYYQGNENNYIGLNAFNAMAFETDAAMIALYEQAGDYIKNDPFLKRRYETALANARTQEGSAFVDYQMVNENEETIALSSFQTEGNYLVVDFFASWCGPCKASMPILADIYNTFGDKGVNLVSIAVWDEAPAYAQAVNEHGIVWNHVFDSKSEGVKVYGVQGVPTFLLISPEGEILVRGHDASAIKSKLEELITL